MNLDTENIHIVKMGENKKSEILTNLRVEKMIDTNSKICKPVLLTDSKTICTIYTFVKRFSLDYPDYELWLDKCRRELELEYKQAVYITNPEGIILGSLIFQKHKEDQSILELKNLRVHPVFEGKKIGSKLIKAVEQLAKEQGFKRIQGDAHSDNPVIEFMIKMGYFIDVEETLYTNKKEAILCKDIKI
ncbi:GNAT family N-acetyltransferase [Candidatus Micrarchaeota archaeon]|jgi:N-acetylglutamate synthase-like GNAT family acetyltransferase|nr:GNAT family N-acetyltransferase [Candidatus Micrarchaeota archaeon]